jgi:hypothetical protein
MFNLNDTILIISFFMYLIRILIVIFNDFLVRFHVGDLLFVKGSWVRLLGNFNDGSLYL